VSVVVSLMHVLWSSYLSCKLTLWHMYFSGRYRYRRGRECGEYGVLLCMGSQGARNWELMRKLQFLNFK